MFFYAVISDKIISPLQSVNPGGAEKVDWDPATKTAFVITGEYTDDKGGQVVAIDYSNGCLLYTSDAADE